MELAYCGLDCGGCHAGAATRANDPEALAKVARMWSRNFGGRYTVEDVTCDGCRSEGGRLSSYCRKCGVRVCASGKGFTTCAECAGYPCDMLAAFLKMAPEARRNLEALRRKAKAPARRKPRGTAARKGTKARRPAAKRAKRGR